MAPRSLSRKENGKRRMVFYNPQRALWKNRNTILPFRNVQFKKEEKSENANAAAYTFLPSGFASITLWSSWPTHSPCALTRRVVMEQYVG